MMLKPYTFHGGEPIYGAALVFAHNAKEARKVGWDFFGDLFTDRYIDCRVNLMRDSDYLFADADQEKLKNDLPHAILEPKSCSDCEMWGHSEIGLDGLCEECRDNILLDKSRDKVGE